MVMPIRKLSSDFMNALQHVMLYPLLTQVQQDDDSLSLFIRKNYINIYFSSDNLLKLSENKDNYVVGFDKNYDPEKSYINEIPKTLDNKETVT